MLAPDSSAQGFEYRFDHVVLRANARGAWIETGSSTVPVAPILREALAESLGGGSSDNATIRATLVSLVGPYASFRVTQVEPSDPHETSAVARRTGHVLMRVIDIRLPSAPATPVSLRDVFTEHEIRSALDNAQDDHLREAYRALGPSYDLEALEAYCLPPDGGFLYEFAFGNIDADHVDILIQEHTPGFGDGLDEPTFFRLKFKVPSALAQSLADAQKEIRGFLAKTDGRQAIPPSFRLRSPAPDPSSTASS